MSSAIGSGVWTAAIFERGGVNLVAEFSQTTSAGMGRRLDEVSEGSVGFPADVDCDVLNVVEPWRHELHLFRDYSEHAAWIGVPSYPKWTRAAITIPARDLFTWLDHRILPVTQDFQNELLSTIFETLFDDAMRADTSPRLALDAQVTAGIGSRVVDAQDRRIAAAELRELARAGLDFTVLGRTIRLTDPQNAPTPATVGVPVLPGSDVPTLAGVLTDDGIEDPDVQVLGPLGVTQAFVLGESRAVEGNAGGFTAAYGLVQGVFNESRIRDVVSATDVSRKRVDQAKKPPLQLNATLTAECPYPFEDLIPGAFAEVMVSVGCKKVEEIMRLISMSVEASGGSETVKASFVSHQMGTQ